MTNRTLDLRLLFLCGPGETDSALALALAEAGFDVIAMQTVDEAIVSAAARDVHVVLLDASQPMVGASRAGGPPVVALLPDNDANAAADALDAGAADWIARGEGPGFVRLLRQTLIRAIEARRIANAARAAADDAAAMRERAEALFTEIRHRIANSMALVVSVAHLQSALMPAGPGRQALGGFADRVLAIAQVHKGLYSSFNVGAVALDTYLGGVTRELEREHVSRRTLSAIAFVGEPISGSVDMAISLGVVLSELVANAARYAYAEDAGGAVRVSLRRISETEAALIVEDDGVGIDGIANFTGGLGSQLIAVLAEGIGGRFDLHPCDRGAQAVLRFSTLGPGEAAQA